MAVANKISKFGVCGVCVAVSNGFTAISVRGAEKKSPKIESRK